MGTWGYGPFENDEAGDVLASIRAGDFDIDQYSTHVDDGYLEVDDAQAAVALAEVLAVAYGLRPACSQLDGIDAAAFARSLTQDHRAWILETLARTVADSDTSELHDLWAENGPEDLETWRAPIVNRMEGLRSFS